MISPNNMVFGKLNPNLVPPFTTDRLLSISQVAAMLDCSTRTVYKWVWQGLIPHYRSKSLIRLRVSDIHKLLFHDKPINSAGNEYPSAKRKKTENLSARTDAGK